jgi:hypothetical protein
MKLRFSLRALLVLTTVVGLACLWRCRPSRLAEQFVAAVKAGDYDRADSLFADREHAFVAKFMSGYRNKANAVAVKQSVGQWLAGTSEVTVDLIDHRGLGASLNVVIPLTALGLEEPQYMGGNAGYTGFWDPETVMRN